jgi:putative transposase
MAEGRTHLTVGTRVLTDSGTGVVVSVAASGYTIRDAVGELQDVGWLDQGTVREIERGEVAPLTQALRPLWDVLGDDAKRVALDRLEVVQEIVTGYRDGHRELARDDWRGRPGWCSP